MRSKHVVRTYIAQPLHALYILGLFQHFEEAESAVERLNANDSTGQEIGVITRRRVLQDQLEAYERALTGSNSPLGAIRGAALGGLTGLLVGLGARYIPGIGSVVMTGPFAAQVGTATSRIAAALLAFGLPRRLIDAYEDGIRKGAVLIAVRVRQQAGQAQDELERAGASHIHIGRTNNWAADENYQRIQNHNHYPA